MSRPAILLSKFVGTISLGLLTGTSYTLSTLALPPLLALPTALPASRAFASIRRRSTRHQALLATLSASSLLLAYFLSSARGRHPYLLYAAGAVGAGWGREMWGLVGGKAEVGDSGSEGEEEWEVEGELNGEVVREGVERWGKGMRWRGCVWGVGWGVCLVGIWGDGVVG